MANKIPLKANYTGNNVTSLGEFNSGDTIGGQFLDLSSPLSIGNGTANTGSFTTLTTSSTVTINGGTANGVAFLNASKVLTTGSALTFDGTTFKATTNAGGVSAFFTDSTYSTLKISHADTSGNIAFLNGANQNYAVFGSSSIFYTSGSEQMRLTSTGLGIGLGGGSPNTRLHVRGNVTIENASNAPYIDFVESGDNTDVMARIQMDQVSSTAGQLLFYTKTGGTLYQRLTLDSSGNLGLGVTPSAWNTSFRALEVYGKGSALFASSAAQTWVTSNAYYDSVGFKYGTSNPATHYQQSYGVHAWFTAPSGTAGNAISFTQAMTLTAAGDLGIGTVSPVGKLHVSDSAVFGAGAINQLVAQQTSAGGAAALALRSLFTNANNTNKEVATLELGIVAYGGSSPSAAIAFKTIHEGTLAERARITSGGELIVGQSALGYASFAPANASTSLVMRLGYGGDFSAITADSFGGNLLIGADESNTKANSFIAFRTDAVERARIDSSGNLLVGTTSALGGFHAAARLAVLNSQNGVAFKTTGSANSWTAATFGRNGNAGGVCGFVYDDNTEVGSITVTSTATAYNTSSDYRLKDIDGPIANSGAYIDALKPVQGSWKADGSRFIGLLAHEAQEVSETTIATGEKDGEQMQAMDYSAPEIIANLIAELQSVRARLAQLEGN